MIRHGTKTVKLIFAILITLICFQTIWLGTWKSPDVNYSGDTNIHTCIHSDDRKLHFKLDVGGGNNFDVYLVENSKPNYLNPYFPSIHIQASQPHNAWIHIVYTDSKDPEWRTFIDARNIDSSGSTYPFYTYEQDFYDAPLWTYSLFNRPLRFWKGHAFAVKVDHQKKYIHCIGGIEWGFELSYFRLRPKATAPQLLNKETWEKAWQILQEKLPGYSQTYGSES
ncbi:hypothetical protein P618_200016 [Holospora obtusa F1]|uniref:Uncharacterized protein n=1 Tax=Holospora obtusa F1 TaxID=1399147 RepID=W6TID2_HOLOB|nr:hypothetical protein P618_200016 [Holospora obtusa F1]